MLVRCRACFSYCHVKQPTTLPSVVDDFKFLHSLGRGLLNFGGGQTSDFPRHGFPWWEGDRNNSTNHGRFPWFPGQHRRPRWPVVPIFDRLHDKSESHAHSSATPRSSGADLAFTDDQGSN